MGPKGKDTHTSPKKQTYNVVRQPISDSSLVYCASDALEGFQERVEQCVEWTVVEEGASRHRKKCSREHMPKRTFGEALQEKIKRSYLKGFFDDDSTMTLDQHWEVSLPLALWDNEKCANEEGKVCFKSENCITDNVMDLLKKVVRVGDRENLRRNLKNVPILRVINSEMTELDEGLKAFRKLVTLNLCGNYIYNIKPSYLPKDLKILELQANAIRKIEGFIGLLPPNLLYLGLSRNLLTNEGLEGLGQIRNKLTVLDLSDNDIYDLQPVILALGSVPSITSLTLAGNPCSVCMGYARTTIAMLPRLRWLDNREVLRTDRPLDSFEYHPDDLRSAYFFFNILRIMSVPPPPKTEKGQTSSFHVELELPLLDVQRRRWLMFRTNDSLTELLPGPEDEEWLPESVSEEGKMTLEGGEAESEDSDIYAHLVTKNSREIFHYTKFKSNTVSWNKLMTFQEPTVKIFCPDLTALRNTFRSVITVRLIYTLITTPVKPTGKPDKKSALALKALPTVPTEQYLVLASIKCPLRRPDWSQPAQHFHWDETMDTDEALHWGEGDLAVLQYLNQQVPIKPGKAGKDEPSMKQQIPEHFTCHFGFGIERIPS